MKRLAIILLTLGLLAGIAPTPAHALDNTAYFQRTKCWGYEPVNGQWLGLAGFGVYFRSVWAPRATAVEGPIYQYHRNNGAECGWLGFPLYPLMHGNGYDVQYFYSPGNPCALPYVVDWQGYGYGVVGYSLPHYFC